MIYTVTLNPSLDYVINCTKVLPGKINRSENENYFAGGKGINVSKVLNILGKKSCAMGFVAGFTGGFIEKSLSDEKIECEFVHLKSGNSRINVKIKSREETDINGRGPIIENEEIEKFLSSLERIKEGDFLVLAGSVPKNLGENFYEKILEKVRTKDIRVVVDAERNLLADCLKYMPFLIKPNNFELEEIVGEKLDTTEKIVEGAKKLREMGARNVFVSRGGDGGVFVSEKDEVFCCDSPKGKVLNTTGAGDSPVAGFISEIEESGDFEKAFRMGISSGSATSFSEGFPTKEEIERIFNSSF